MEERHKLTIADPSIVGGCFLLWLLVICANTALAQVAITRGGSSHAATPSPSPSPSPSPGATPAAAIPLSEIAIRGTELKLELRGYEDLLNRDSALEAIEQALKSSGVTLNEELSDIERLIGSAGGYNEILDLKQTWTARKVRNAKWHQMLTDRSNAVLQMINRLLARRDEWIATRSQAEEAGVIEQVAPAIESARKELETAGKRAHDQLNYLLGLQDRLSRDELAVLDVLNQLERAEASMKRSLWIRDSPPLWNIKASFQSESTTPQYLAGSVEYNTSRVKGYLRAHLGVVIFFLAIFFGAFAISLWLRRNALAKSRLSSATVSSDEFFMHPVAVAFLVAFSSVLPAMVSAPVVIRVLLLLGLLITTVYLLPSRLSKPYRYTLYLLVLFLLATGVSEASDWSLSTKRWILFSLTVVAVAAAVVMLRRIHREQLTGSSTRWLFRAIFVAVVIIIISGIANIVGYFRLSFLLKNAVVLTAAFGAALYTGYLVSTSLIDNYLLVRRSSFITSIQSRHDEIMKWVCRILALGFFIVWIVGALEFLALRDQAAGWLNSILALQLSIGSVTITLKDVLTFLAVFILGMFLATLIRFVLRVDVLGRLNLKHGIPYAIATITYYIMVILVFVLALAASGVELSRFTLLTGAFGIGVGFGLQNIISNFVSGIILLFERPVRIGDSLEIGPTSGEVERIGMRSTSIRTWQGAEVIVPNSDLISQQVVNWTLTRPRRRIELAVKVVLGANPAEVIDLLEGVARAHADVLKDPPPTALFSEFGDGSLNFVLRAWVLQSSGHERVKSEVGVTMVAELKAKGIDVAVRQPTVIVRDSEDLLPDIPDRAHR
jgi:potassium-dependent mechanosensitive channel